jgi:hypothetical protein
MVLCWTFDGGQGAGGRHVTALICSFGEFDCGERSSRYSGDLYEGPACPLSSGPLVMHVLVT